MTAPQPHPIPVVISRLYELTKAAADALADPADDGSIVRVDLGNPGEFQEFAAIGIGLGTTPVEPVEDRQIVRGLAHDNHDFDVVCVALAWSGDDDRRAWMVRAFELVDIVRGVVDDPTNRHLGLDRMVQSAAVDRLSFMWEQDRRSMKALVEFTVRVQAYRKRPGR